MHSRREAIVKSLNAEHSTDERLTRDQNLLKVYLTDEHALHIRRTLDQYYYHTTTDTPRRDEDQFLGFYQMKNNLQPKIPTMIDQLWLWVLSNIIDAPADPEKIARIEESYAGQRATAIWGARNDPDDFSLPLVMVKASIDEFNGMLRRAERVSQSVHNHLNRVSLKLG